MLSHGRQGGHGGGAEEIVVEILREDGEQVSGGRRALVAPQANFGERVGAQRSGRARGVARVQQQCVGQGDPGGGVGVAVERGAGPVGAAGADEEAGGGPAGVRSGSWSRAAAASIGPGQGWGPLKDSSVSRVSAVRRTAGRRWRVSAVSSWVTGPSGSARTASKTVVRTVEPGVRADPSRTAAVTSAGRSGSVADGAGGRVLARGPRGHRVGRWPPFL
ncbi:hypothetical protein [Streptomyces sp. bgisy084]|uniref:hypothetical protein n=1 Tax=unclassified Streptomyces TaxID=2593676 RepID=UPI003D7072B6